MKIDLKSKFDTATQNYGGYKHLAESDVTEWQWSNGKLYVLELFYFQRHNSELGTLLKVPPEEVSSLHYQYGLNASGNVVVARQFTGIVGQFYEQFYLYDDEESFVDAILYDYSKDKAVINVERQISINGEIVKFSRIATHGEHTEKYSYQNDKVVSVVYGNNSPEQPNLRVTYDADGQLSAISQDSYILYQKLRNDQTIDSLSSIFKTNFINSIPRIVAKAVGQERVCCIVLLYTWAGNFLPPMLCIALESDCQKVKHNPQLWRQFLEWPAEWSHFLDSPKIPDNQEYEEACRLLNQELTMHVRPEPILQKILSDVAIEMMKMDWGDVVKLAPDFKVFPRDTENQDFFE